MKIRLIEPKPPGVTVFDRARLPRLGLPLLGRILHDLGHDVRIYVETLAPVDWEDVETADLVGVSTTSSTAPTAYAMADRLRDVGIPVVIGGPHVTFLPDEALEHADFVIRGEGQEAIVELIAALDGEVSLASIAGLSYRGRDGQPIHNPPRPPCPQERFAELPSPALDLIVGHERMTNIPIMTQWGCPYNCAFCSVIRMFGRHVRWRQVETVLDELENYRGRGSIFFYDDNFVVNRKRTMELLRGMIERGMEFTWSAQVRAEVVYRDKRTGEIDEELLELMRDSGCRMVYCGFESVNPATLEAYNKHQSVEEIRESIRTFHRYGIRVHGMFALGADTDDKATFRRTASFALEMEIDTVQFLILTPLPGTPLYEQLEAEDRLITRDWSYYDGHHCTFQPAQMSPYELQIGAYKAMAHFYSLPKAIWLLTRTIVSHLPFFSSVIFREKKLRLRLPRIALWSLIPSRRNKLLPTLRQLISEHTWERIQQIVGTAVLRLYGHRKVKEWIHQQRSRRYLRRLNRLNRPSHQCADPQGRLKAHA